jgi:hypothetical protein
MNKLAILAAAFLLLAVRWAAADCGAIPFNSRVVVFEPNQRAVIAFNGDEEILLLSTDLHATEPTKVLQVLPLPAEPKVTKGDFDVFVNATNLINSKLNANRGAPGGFFGGMGGGAMPAPAVPAGKLTFHDKIGSHEISVTRVLNKRGFIEWVENYLRKAGADNPTILDPMKDVVAEYLKDGFQWFVFDVVELTKDMKTKEAIQYHFRSQSLYYPLRITRTEEGDTLVRLLILSPELVRLPDLGKVQVRLAHDPVRVSFKEVRSLGSDDISALVKYRQCMLRTWELQGPLSGFTKDIVTSMAL